METLPVVQTVTGPVATDALGITLTHEHLLIDMTCYWRMPKELGRRRFATSSVAIEDLAALRRDPLGQWDNIVLDDLDVAVEEIMDFRKLGGSTVIDVTLPDIGRDIPALQAAARVTGLNIIAGCGHYLHLAHPTHLQGRTVEEIADDLVSEIRDGIGDSGVKPGVIGEIGTSDPLHPREETVLRAAARAQVRTGLPITLHLDPAARAGHHILDILESEGGDPSRIAMGHLDASIDEELAYHKSLASRGCYVQYDSCGGEMYFPGLAGGGDFWLPSDRARATAIAHLCAAGFQEKILISHDVCKKMDLRRFGGPGYGHTLRSFGANLRDAGLSHDEIDQIMIENPARLLAPGEGKQAEDREGGR